MKCERCPMGGDAPCAGEAGRWAGLACKMAENGEAGVRWVVDRSAEVEPAPAEAPAYPSKLQMAANLITAAVDFVASGCEVVDREEYDRRRAICRACPSGLYVLQDDACLACGCNMRAKSWGAAWTCDRGHWEKDG